MTTDLTHNQSLAEMDRASMLHPFTPIKDFADGKLGSRIVAEGQGCRIRDHAGKEYIDAFGGLYCVNVGYGRTEIAAAIAEQAKRLPYFHAYGGHSNEPAIRLSDRLLRMAPGPMSKVYFGLSGSDANEVQVKLVWYYNNILGRPQKKKLIARQRGYHGGTIMSGSLTGLPAYHKAFDLPLSFVKHTTAPYYYWGAEPGETESDFSRRCAADLEALILAEGPDTVAAFFGEPLLGTGGIVPPPANYWAEISAVLKKYDVLLIADEVVCGFGRLGTPFGCHLYDIQPDMVTVAKGLTSAYLPLSAAMVSQEMFQVLSEKSVELGPFGHGYTYSAHPTCAAAAMANLDIIEREGLVDNARVVGTYFKERLDATFGDHPLVGDVRGVGMLGVIEFVADKAKKVRLDPNLKVGPRISNAAAEHGLIARAMPNGDMLGFAPPLSVTRADVDAIVERAKRAVDQVADELAREGALAA